MNMQAKLLRVLQEGEIEPIGAPGPVKVDVRIISATRRDLQSMVKRGEFREDLYFRLNEVSIHMPKLCERTEDIRLLAEHMLAQINQKYKTNVALASDVIPALEKYYWPGNIRELNNVLKSAYSVAENEEITLFNLPPYISLATEREKRGVHTLRKEMEEYEKSLIIRSLLESGCNYRKAAEKLGLHRSNLYRKIEKYGIDIEKLKGQWPNHG